MKMNYRTFALGATILALFCVTMSPLAAQQTPETTHDGKVVSVAGNKIVMKSMDGKEHSHTLNPGAKLTLDGRICTAAELKPGTRIRVTTQVADQSVATRVEAIDKNTEFVSVHRDGKVVSITGNTLVMTGLQDSQQQTCMLNNEVKVTCDGQLCKPSDLKPGMRVRVTSASDSPFVAIRVEAIDKNLKFAAI